MVQTSAAGSSGLAAGREDTASFYGIRGVSASPIMTFHCDLIVWFMPHHGIPPLYGG